jgi:hypothetical protein
MMTGDDYRAQQPVTPLSDQLAIDYGTVLSVLSLEFGTPFELTSTGGGCYALCAKLENGDLVIITSADDATLNPVASRGGYGVGIYAETGQGDEQVVYLADPLMHADPETDLGDRIGDLVAVVIWQRLCGLANRCTECGAHIADPHAPGCTLDSAPDSEQDR